jgi:hypothetical protein
MFDNAITNIALNQTSLPLNDKNNAVIKTMFANRDLFINQDNDGPMGMNDSSISYREPSRSNTEPIFTAEGLRENREREFNAQLGRHQTEFQTLMSRDTPSDIDFRDDVKEDKIGGDMERLIADAEARRRRDLEAIGLPPAGQNLAETEKWINGGRPLKIDMESSLGVDAVPIVSKKSQELDKKENQVSSRKVRFSEEPSKSSQDDVFSRLKSKRAESPARVRIPGNQKPFVTDRSNNSLDVGDILEKLEAMTMSFQSSIYELGQRLHAVEVNVLKIIETMENSVVSSPLDEQQVSSSNVSFEISESENP